MITADQLRAIYGDTRADECLWAALGTDFVSEPELLEQPEYGALAAGWFWDSRKLNTLADQQMFVTMTKRINGGTNGLSDRIALYERAKQVLGA